MSCDAVDGDVLIKFKDGASGTAAGAENYIPIFHSPSTMLREAQIT